MKAKLFDSFVEVNQKIVPALPSSRLPSDVSEDLARLAPRPTEPAAEPVSRLRPIAVFVAHGMGQQVPFESLDGVVSALRRAHLRRGFPAPGATVRQIQRGDLRIARAEVAATMPNGETREVHLFEGYWAPLAEGQITLRETFSFLISAGFAGARRSLVGNWWRMMFNRRHEFSLTARTFYAFVTAMLVLASIGLMNAIVATVAASRALTASTSGWPSGPLLADLTVDFGLCLAVTGSLLLLGLGGTATRRRITPDGRVRTPSPGTVRFGWACVWGAVGAVIAVGSLVVYHLARHFGHDASRMWAGTWADYFVGGFDLPAAPPWQVILTTLIWGLVAVASWFGRGFLLQYVGDVAIYVSSHRVNRFALAREAIRKASDAVLRLIYSERRETDGPLYEEVIVIGHSLGSVVAYDALNAMIREDIAVGGSLRVIARTPFLLTSGSPLDKTAFIFRTQVRDEADTREALAQSIQPLLTDYTTRPARWINIWSRNDWISGSLEYYDDGSRPTGDAQHVQNLEDPQATTPLAAHNEYWDGELFGDLMFDAVSAAAASQETPGASRAVESVRTPADQ